eukprot:1126315-Pelagomonas_calceolata.AAC.2
MEGDDRSTPPSCRERWPRLPTACVEWEEYVADVRRCKWVGDSAGMGPGTGDDSSSCSEEAMGGPAEVGLPAGQEGWRGGCCRAGHACGAGPAALVPPATAPAVAEAFATPALAAPAPAPAPAAAAVAAAPHALPLAAAALVQLVLPSSLEAMLGKGEVEMLVSVDRCRCSCAAAAAAAAVAAACRSPNNPCCCSLCDGGCKLSRYTVVAALELPRLKGSPAAAAARAVDFVPHAAALAAAAAAAAGPAAALQAHPTRP